MRAGPVTAGGRAIGDTAWAVIGHPVRFFQAMPKTGGFRAPLQFLFVIAFFDALLVSLSLLIGGGPLVLATTVHMLLFTPLAFVVSGFLFSAVLFVFWRLMGSTESYQTAYRVFAYSCGITPVTTLLGLVPYLPIVSLAWWFGLFAIASIHVHGIHRLKSAAVFAALALAAAVFVVRLEHRVLQPLGRPSTVQQSSATGHGGVPVARV